MFPRSTSIGPHFTFDRFNIRPSLVYRILYCHGSYHSLQDVYRRFYPVDIGSCPSGLVHSVTGRRLVRFRFLYRTILLLLYTA